ncbi:MAG: hypothetical protein FJZ47_16335 [Candidatus Tectomicrobia bacterium]|uniref:PEGA domain-containing protein n=1 Tax=Tectimicrobiota bacterium TaxID=2528274 RepID=A0A937W357_UNCTE|nr:hypothetical protein [Candidatus Tectomicrobia bacterium]
MDCSQLRTIVGIGVLVLCLEVSPAMAHRVFLGGSLVFPGIALQVGVGGGGRHYHGYRHRHHYHGFRPSVFVSPWFYAPAVVYAPPPVVYAAPPAVYVAPPVVTSQAPVSTATVQVRVTPLLADVYLDGRYVGRAQDFPEGRVQLSVTAGSHTIELRLGTISHVHTVTANPGATVVVNDRLS